MTYEEKIIPGFGSKYLVRDNGTIYSLYSNKELNQTDNGKGYLNVKLQLPLDKTNGVRKYKTCYIHRLVAQAFITNANELPQVNHIDGNKSNNCVTNLEWCTALQNTQHAIATNLTTLRESFMSIEDLEATIILLLTENNIPTKELAKKYGYSKTSTFNRAIKEYLNNDPRKDKVLEILKQHTLMAHQRAASSLGKPVYGIHKETKEKTEIFPTRSAAARFCGGTAINITTAINSNSYAKGYYWYEINNGRPEQECSDNKAD